MQIETLKTEEYESVKKLADLSVKISEAKDTFAKLQATETDYLELREKKATEEIQKILDDSSDLLDKTYKNYDEINTFCNVVSSYADFLDEVYGKFQGMVENFNKKNELWSKTIKEQTIQLSDLEKKLTKDSEIIKEKEKMIVKQSKELEKERTHIESQQATLETSYNELKKLEEKLWQTK